MHKEAGQQSRRHMHTSSQFHVLMQWFEAALKRVSVGMSHYVLGAKILSLLNLKSACYINKVLCHILATFSSELSIVIIGRVNAGI